jgi:hypothetical protein
MLPIKKIASVVAITAAVATMSFGDLPSASLSRQQIGPKNSGGRNSRVEAKAPSVTDAIDWASYKAVPGGAIVKKGEFEGNDLYWLSQWEVGTDDIPGEFADSGGTSGWALLNSKAFNDGVEYKWIGWNSNAPKWKIAKIPLTWDYDESQIGDWGSQIEDEAPGAYIPTWRDGAEGAYSMIHDDIGAMDLDGSVNPANEVAYDHPNIRAAWGMKVDVMDDEEWAGAKMMVMNGHEMLNHSWDHSSAADQWQWHFHGDILSVKDPALPKELRGLEVDSALTGGKDLKVSVPYLDYDGGDPFSPETLSLELTFKVSSDYTFDSVEVEHDGWSEWQYESTGKVLAGNKGWSDDAAKTVAMLKIYCVPGWANMPNRAAVNIKAAKDVMDEMLYSQVESPYFQKGKRTEYYVYPYDAYSNKTHDLVLAEGHIASRGGAKSGMPLPGDFFQPFRIDFDAFFMMNSTADKIYPDNPHQRLSLEGLVDRIVKTKGYMIREFHACADVDLWSDANEQAMGGWWGGIPKTLYKTHFEYLDGLINTNQVTVFTPTEAVKYRLTTNAAKSASIEEDGDKFTLSVDGGTLGKDYQDEISVIVVFDEAIEDMDVQYATDSDFKDEGERPRYAPRKMDDGKSWSISINPYAGKQTITPGVKFPIKPAFQKPDEVPNAISTSALMAKITGASFTGIQNGRVALNLPAGNYTAELFNSAGRMIKSTKVLSNNGIVRTGLTTNNLSTGMFILNVRGVNGAQVMPATKFLVK